MGKKWEWKYIMEVASGVQSPSKHNLIKKYKLKLRDYLLFLPKKLRKWKLGDRENN